MSSKGNDLIVPMRKGEVYEIWVYNRSNRMVAMRLLVDGLNTLPEKEKVKGIITLRVAPRVSLDEARPWVLDPATTVEGPFKNLFRVQGFVTETGASGKLRDFKVVDLDQSIAARQQFTDQIGLITAAFYAPGSGARGIGTGFGREHEENLGERLGVKAGNLLCVINIRYVEADALNRGT